MAGFPPISSFCLKICIQCIDGQLRCLIFCLQTLWTRLFHRNKILWDGGFPFSNVMFYHPPLKAIPRSFAWSSIIFNTYSDKCTLPDSWQGSHQLNISHPDASSILLTYLTRHKLANKPNQGRSFYQWYALLGRGCTHCNGAHVLLKIIQVIP